MTQLNTQKINQLVDEPIHFLESSTQQLEEQLPQAYEKILENRKLDIQKVIELKEEIANKRIEIAQRSKKDKIGARKFANVIIIIFCFIILGLFFLSFLIKNNKIIKEFNKFQKSVHQEMADINTQKNNLIISVLNNIVPYKIVKDQLLKLGLYLYGKQNFINIEVDDIDVNGTKLVGYFEGMHVKFKSTDTYFITTKEFSLRNVVTSGSIPVYYYVDGKSYTKMVTATHTEPTPTITSNPYYLQKTNYAPEFSFRNHQNAGKIQKNAVLVNNDFMKLYGIGNTSINLAYDTKIIDFFSSLAQENYVNFAKKNNYITSSFGKQKHALYIADKEIDNFDFSLLLSRMPFGTWQGLKLDYQSDVWNTLKPLIDEHIALIRSYLKNLTYANLSPALSREWYVQNEDYKMMVNYDYATYYTNNSVLTPLSLTSKLFGYNALEIPQTCEVAPFAFVRKEEKAFGVVSAQIDVISYNKIERIDHVVSYAYEYGTVTVPVPYIEYQEYSVPFLTMYILKNKPERDNFTLNIFNNRFRHFASQPIFDEVFAEVAEYFQEEQTTNNAEMINTQVKQLQTQLAEWKIDKNDVSFIIDEDGYFLVFKNESQDIANSNYEWFANWLRKINL
ncbi:hypothetical protein OF377_01285 [Ureaplasma sp. ES3154-GEN]|uniref:hypothetical protein n=1 Tax=Ureaplasma sp. ES3154-GEN TaxID=2984844 RepID=UPI0021E73383|nr:hypothetical protein [Ureaplasma sp. ES3154-GEN]MCV3743520.1 hypothetical protein [Ureaplasma sp. ES3154-GEN]